MCLTREAPEPLKLGGRELGGKRRTGPAGVKGRAGCLEPDRAEVPAAEDLCPLAMMGRRKPKAARPRMRPQ